MASAVSQTVVRIVVPSYLSPSRFAYMNPSCVRLFPHVVLIIYTFSISRLFFSQLFRSVRRGFHLTPLSTYMRGDAPGISPNASPIYPLSLQSLTHQNKPER